MANIHIRHPRYTAILAVILFLVVVQVLFRPTEKLRNTKLFTSNSGPDSSLQTYLDNEEARYRLALIDREGLVKKWGPTAQDVASFPKNGPMYTLWDFFIPSFRCPHRVERLGTLGDGGKWFCGIDRIVRQRVPCVIYSFGINGESSFEAAVLSAAPQCEIWGYDFSVNAFGPEIEDFPDLKARAHFFPYALGGTDSPDANPPTFTLQTLMARNGHTFIDVLKVDVEGWEFESLASFVDHFVPAHADPSATSPAVLPVGQLQLEIHAWPPHVIFHEFKHWWESLERAGLRPFWTEPNLVYVNIMRGSLPDLAEYSFMNIRGSHALIDDNY